MTTPPLIITVTLNPAVDQAGRIDRLRVGSVHRLADPLLDPAGKGINVARMAHRLGAPTRAMGFVAGETGTLIERALDREGVPHEFVRVAGATRVNLTVVDDGGATTSFLGPGPFVSPDRSAALFSLSCSQFAPGRVLVLAGSLPPGIPEDHYAMYVRAARERGVTVLLDADEQAMRAGIDAGPDLIKPNVPEAERLVGRRLPDVLSVIEGARELAARVPMVVVSMGEKGAIGVRGDRVLRAYAPKVTPRSSVGVGDAMVAGLAVRLARNGDFLDALRLGVAAGSAAAAMPGTSVGTSEQVQLLIGSVQVAEMLSEPHREVWV